MLHNPEIFCQLILEQKGDIQLYICWLYKIMSYGAVWFSTSDWNISFGPVANWSSSKSKLSDSAIMEMLTSRLFWLCIRNFGGISACSCGWKPAQTLKWYVARVLIHICGAKYHVNKINRRSWLTYGKFFEYPFSSSQLVYFLVSLP